MAVQRAIDDEVRHLLDDVREVERRDAIALEVRRRIQVVDRVGHAVLDRELDRVHLVAERQVDRLRVADDPRADLRRQVLVLDEVLAARAGRRPPA